jgi:hypothetical protein
MGDGFLRTSAVSTGYGNAKLDMVSLVDCCRGLDDTLDGEYAVEGSYIPMAWNLSILYVQKNPAPLLPQEITPSQHRPNWMIHCL